MLKLMGALDVATSLVLILLALKLEIPHVLLIISAAYLIVKVLCFIWCFDYGCAIDLFAALLLILAIFYAIPAFLLLIASALLIVKGFLSFA